MSLIWLSVWHEFDSVQLKSEIRPHFATKNYRNLLIYWPQVRPHFATKSLNCEADYTFIDCELPLLEHLVMFVIADNWGQTDSIDKLIRKNPQIRAFSMSRLPDSYVKFISESLPNLEELFIFAFALKMMKLNLKMSENSVFFRSVPSLLPICTSHALNNSGIGIMFQKIHMHWPHSLRIIRI